MGTEATYPSPLAGEGGARRASGGKERGALDGALAYLALRARPLSLPSLSAWAPPAPGLRSAPGTPVPSAPTREEGL